MVGQCKQSIHMTEPNKNLRCTCSLAATTTNKESSVMKDHV